MNRLSFADDDFHGSVEAFSGVHELELDDMALSWDEITRTLNHFVTLRNLSASSNGLSFLKASYDSYAPAFGSTLTSLNLEHNQFKSLSDLIGVKCLPALEKLFLKGNEISKIFPGDGDRDSDLSKEKLIFYERLRYIDLSYNAVQSWDFIEGLPDVFPGMTGLRLSHNPINLSSSTDNRTLWTLEVAHMLTVARLGKLTSLNYGAISPAERTEAETYYLSQIAKEMAEVPEHLEHTVTSQHKRYAELCKIHGAPDVIRKGPSTVNPNFLEARLIRFTFYMPANTLPGQQESIIQERELPKGIDIYSMKGIVGRIFGKRPLDLKLIWETGTMDPVAGSDDIIDDGSDEDISMEGQNILSEQTYESQLSRFVQREVEIEDSTRQIGNFVDGAEARVRVELR